MKKSQQPSRINLSGQPGELFFYPYLFKEYRNRWFVPGMHKKDKRLLTLELNGIQKIDPLAAERYKEQCDFNGMD